MKKGLSILLIAAALFGFYGSAVNLNDILACKDYWEEEGEKSTANLNKLEDGLNQLKDNEKAYLDGKDQVAEGEKTLADAEVQLAEGEAKLADGYAQYEQGLADYEAAPAKLADGKRQLDENKDAYTAGKSFKKVIDKASNGLSNKGAYGIINGLLASAGVEGVPASYSAMAETRSQLNTLKDGTDNITGMSSEEAFKVALSTLDSDTQKQLKAAGVTSYKALKETIKTAENGREDLKKLKKNVDNFTGKTEKELREIFVDSSDDLKDAGIKSYKALKSTEGKLRAGKNLINKLAGMKADQLKDYLVSQSGDLKAAGIKDYDALSNSLDALTAGKKQIDNLEADRDALKNYIVSNNAKLKKAGIKNYKTLAAKSEALTAGKKQIDDLEADRDALKDYIVAGNEKLAKAGITDYAGLEDKIASLENGKKLVDSLVNDRDALKDYIVAGNEDLANAGIKKFSDIDDSIASLNAGKAKVDQVAGLSDAELQEFLVGNSADLKNNGITSYAGDKGLAATSQGLTNLKNMIDSNSDLDTETKKDNAVKAQGIKGISDADHPYQTLVAKEAALKAAKNKIDGLVADRDALRDYIVAGNEDLANAGITKYSDFDDKVNELNAGKAKINGIAAMEDADLQDFLVSQAAENDADMKAAGITTYTALTGTLQELKGGKQQIDQIAGMKKADLKDFLVSQSEDLKDARITDYETLAGTEKQLSDGKKEIDKIAGMKKSALKDFLVSQSSDLKKAGINTYSDLKNKQSALAGGKKTIDGIAAMDKDARRDAFVGQNEDLANAGIKNYKKLEEKSSALTAGKKKIDTLSKDLNKANSKKALAFVWTQLTKSQKSGAKSQGVDGTSYKALLNAIKSLGGTVSSLKELKSGTDNVTGMSSNEALKTAVGTQSKATQKKLKDSGITSYKSLKKAISSLDQLAGFTKVLTSQKGNSKEKTYKNIINTLKNAGYGDMISALPASYAKLSEALGTYEDGVRQYKKGLADYAAAPGKLADARAQLADGEAQLADGRQQIEDGRAKLEAGKEQLAQYEDGEQQVRDGLATLVGTEPDLDLVGIAERLNGDTDFDNGDKHLELDEGLNAVQVGREYQSDDGDLITKEIMARAVGTAGLLGAGILAVLAAILSFLKKNKGAAVLAILAAAAGAFGAFYGTNAGTYFSDIAGSTAGSAGWVAAGILGVVALAHAIVHFTAKPEA